MQKSAAQHRKQYRKILTWSFVAAVIVHIAVIWGSPDFEVEPLSPQGSTAEGDIEDDALTTALEVVFGPPIITTADGSFWQEPEDRTLEAMRLTELPLLCAHLSAQPNLPMRATFHLTVSSRGHAKVEEIAESTGDNCADGALSRAADALRYHWLPSSRFPAPVSLVQPVTLLAVSGY